MARQDLSHHRRVPHDVCVIYPSRETPGQYVAHSLRTDQIGMGQCVLDAYVELLKALIALYDAAAEDRRIEVERIAPDHVWAMIRDAKRLPLELEETAMRLALGKRAPEFPSEDLRSDEPIQASPSLELLKV